MEHVLDTSNEASVLLLLLLCWTASYRCCIFGSFGATEMSTIRDCDCSTQVERNMFLKHLLYSNPLEKINSTAGVLTTHENELLGYFRQGLYTYKVKWKIQTQLQIQVLYVMEPFIIIIMYYFTSC